jgi:hypothetical protein
MLKYSVQTFYQLLFSHSFPFSNSSPFQKLPTPKIPKQKNQGKAPQKPKPSKVLQTKSQRQKAKSPQPSFRGPFINSGKQGGAETLGSGVTL